jgi:ABC-type dipeptide/oligopeptide/nickel transport system ATPase component
MELTSMARSFAREKSVKAATIVDIVGIMERRRKRLDYSMTHSTGMRQIPSVVAMDLHTLLCLDVDWARNPMP